MRELIRKFPEMAKIVLKNCVKEKKNNQKKVTLFNCEFLEDTFKYTESYQHVRKWLNLKEVKFYRCLK